MSECFIYVIAQRGKEALSGPVKVGISADPEKRLRTLQTATPFKIEIVCKILCPSREVAKEMEATFHETQKKRQLHGEWFDYEPYHAVGVLCLAFRYALAFHGVEGETLDACLDLSGIRDAERCAMSLLAAAKGSLQ